MYRTICTQLWTDPKVRTLSVHGKLLFVYAITNPHTHLSGMYYLPMELLKKETGISDTLSHTLCDTLSEMDLVHRDTQTETIFVTNMFRYQGKGAKNEQAAANHLLTLHQSSLIHRFFHVYPSVQQYWKGYPIDTLSDRGTEANKRCPSVPNPVPALLTTPNPDLQSNPKTKLRLISEEDRPSEKHFRFGQSLGLDVGPEWGKFKNYCLAHAKRYANFEAAFRNWLANAETMKGKPHGLR